MSENRPEQVPVPELDQLHAVLIGHRRELVQRIAGSLDPEVDDARHDLAFVAMLAQTHAAIAAIEAVQLEETGR